MAFRLSTGFRNQQLGDAYSTWGNQVLLGEDTSASDVSASWTDTTVATTGNNTVSGRTGVLSISDAVGNTEQEITVIPNHTYRLTYDVYSTGTTDTLKVDIGATTGDDDIYSGVATVGIAAWTSYGSGTTTIFNDDALSDGAIMFTAGDTTTSVFLNFTRNSSGDVFSIDNVRLMDQAMSLQDIFKEGSIKIYSGTQPTTADAAPTGTLLVTINKDGSEGFSFNDAASGSIAKLTGETWQGTCGSTGTAGWARLVTSTDGGALSTTDPRCDMAVGTSGAQINFTSTSFTSGSTQTITTFAVSIPTG